MRESAGLALDCYAFGYAEEYLHTRIVNPLEATEVPQKSFVDPFLEEYGSTEIRQGEIYTVK